MSFPSGIEDVNYYFITDERLDISPSEQVEIAVRGGAKMIQYRRKTADPRAMYQEALEVGRVCKDRALFIVNDRIDIALAVGSDGVHLGQDDLPYNAARELIGDMILGVSTHNKEQAARVVGTADYIGIGPVHATDTKDDRWTELGVEGALEIARSVDVPAAAIGGIDVGDISPLSTGFDMICALSSVTRRGDIEDRVRLFESEFGRCKRLRR